MAQGRRIPSEISFSVSFSLPVVTVQSLSCVWLFVTPWTTACQAPLFLLRFMSIELVMLSNHLILCHPLLLLLLIFPSIRVFSNDSALHIRWPKDWSYRFNVILPMNIQDLFPLGLTGLISLQSNRLSRVFSTTTVWKHQFFGVQPSLMSNSHIYTSFLIRSQYSKNAFRIIVYFALHHFKG